MSGPKLCVAVITGPHGVRGSVRVKSFTEDPSDAGRYGPLSDKDGTRRFELTVTGTAKGLLIAKVDGVDDRDAAEALKGTELYLERDALPTLAEPDEYYHADLIGLTAVGPDDTTMGTVKAVFDFGSGDLLEIATADGGSEFVPFRKETVTSVDLAAGRLVVEPTVELSPDGASEDER